MFNVPVVHSVPLVGGAVLGQANGLGARTLEKGQFPLDDMRNSSGPGETTHLWLRQPLGR